MNDIRFNSIPIHTSNQLFDEIETIVPSIRVMANNRVYGNEESIKDEWSRTSHFIVRSYIIHRAFLIFVNLRILLVIHEVAR